MGVIYSILYNSLDETKDSEDNTILDKLLCEDIKNQQVTNEDPEIITDKNEQIDSYILICNTEVILDKEPTSLEFIEAGNVIVNSDITNVLDESHTMTMGHVGASNSEGIIRDGSVQVSKHSPLITLVKRGDLTHTIETDIIQDSIIVPLSDMNSNPNIDSGDNLDKSNNMNLNSYEPINMTLSSDTIDRQIINTNVLPIDIFPTKLFTPFKPIKKIKNKKKYNEFIQKIEKKKIERNENEIERNEMIND